MKVLIRVDSGIVIANGHVMRCLTLANKLRLNNVEVIFVCKQFTGNIIDIIKASGFETLMIPCEEMSADAVLNRELGSSQEADANLTKELLHLKGIEQVDWVVVDHYALDEKWHKAISSIAKRIFVIDDLANRNYFCDVLLDQTLGREESNYKKLTQNACKLILGTKYTLLRDEFGINKEKAFNYRACYDQTHSKSALIMMGGTDPDNYSGRVFEQVYKTNQFSRVTIVLGRNAPHLAHIKEQIKELTNVFLLEGLNNVTETLLTHDVCFGAAGTSAWERCSLGLPTFLFVLAENQQTVASELEASGAVKVVPINSPTVLVDEISTLLINENYQEMVKHCFAICDGKGTERIINEVFYGY